jgi:FAD/FMN-containing dehydrogenase
MPDPALHLAAPPAGFRGIFRTDASARAVYSEAAGIGRALPAAVAVPGDAADVAALVRWALDQRAHLIPRGSGSSMAGGAIGDGVAMDTSRLREMGPVDVARRCVRVGVGATRGEVERLAKAAGLRFPVDPSSGEFCTIGGMTATNAAGPHSVLHGPMRPWVRALECVLADGSVATFRRGEPAPKAEPVQRFLREVHPGIIASLLKASDARVIKNSSGYAISAYAQSHDLIDLLVGSEGTLAVFTAVELALVPAVTASASMLVAFRSLEDAVTAAVLARAGGVAACELLDRTFLEIAARDGRPLPVTPDSEAALMVEIESHDQRAATAEAERLRSLFRANGAEETIVAIGAADEAELWHFRHAASPALAKLSSQMRSMQFIEDAAVPPESLAAYVRGVREILHRNDTPGVIFGHAGDAHVHVNPLVDTSRPDWRRRVETILLDVTDLVARLGGTSSGEHGDGRLRTPLMDRTWSADERRVFAAIKKAFDPDGVLNPGVKVPLPNQRAIDAVKYDPALDALPEDAARVLATVERERAYARFRLDLL